MINQKFKWSHDDLKISIFQGVIFINSRNIVSKLNNFLFSIDFKNYFLADFIEIIIHNSNLYVSEMTE